jgi:hypothetical protein
MDTSRILGSLADELVSSVKRKEPVELLLVSVGGIDRDIAVAERGRSMEKKVNCDTNGQWQDYYCAEKRHPLLVGRRCWCDVAPMPTLA